MNRSQGKAVKITKEIFQVGGSQITSSEDAAIYLINLCALEKRLILYPPFHKPIFHRGRHFSGKA